MAESTAVKITHLVTYGSHRISRVDRPLIRLFAPYIIFLVVVSSSAAQQSNTSLNTLRSRIKLSEELIQRYPEAKNDIQGQMQEDLKAAVAQISADLDYFITLQATRPSETLKKIIADLQAESARYRSSLRDQPGTGSSAVSSAPNGVATPAAALKQTTSTAQQTVGSASTVQNVLPSSLVYWIDISKNPGMANRKGCSNLPRAHDAGIWNVVVSVRPVVPASELPEEAKLLNYYTIGNTLFLPVQRILRDSVTLVAGKRTYTGTTIRRARTVAIIFEDLTLAEAGDVIDQLTKNPDKIRDAFTSAGLTFHLYRSEFSAPADRALDPADYYAVLKSKLEPKDVIPVLQSAAEQKQPLTMSYLDPAFQRNVCAKDPVKAATNTCKPFAVTIQVQEIDSPELANLLQNVRIDTAILQQTKQNLTDLINSQNASTSTNLAESSKSVKADAVVGLAMKFLNQETTTTDKQPITIIDDPCFSMSLGPSSSGNFKPVINFKARYDYFSPSGAFFMKLKAEGDGGVDTSYFQRLQTGGEASALFIKGRTGWQLNAGGVGQYSVSRLMGVKLDESKAGAKLEVQTPFVRILDTLPGSNSKPTVILEFVSSQPSLTKKNAFDLNTKFAYTLRPTSELSFDFDGIISKSSERRFGSDDFNSYLSIRGRYSLFNFGDYILKYECGRKEPDYRKVCGWQTGLVTLIGR